MRYRGLPVVGEFVDMPADVAICGPGLVLPVDRLADIAVPVLAIDGGENRDWIRAATRAVAAAIPGARYVTPARTMGCSASPGRSAPSWLTSPPEPVVSPSVYWRRVLIRTVRYSSVRSTPTSPLSRLRPG